MPTITDGDMMSNEKSQAPAVAFSHVSFSYGNGEEALTDITVEIPRGATVGVIGGTGSGKSTLINLLVRFYDVSAGSVQVNGVDVREYPLEILRQKIGIVPQQSELFTGTVAENIRYGKEDATEEEIRQAAATAQAAEFIEQLPQGYDSQVERGGTNLSGGQKQRLTIARALVRRPQILILDDSSSALDYATDAALRRAIYVQSHDMTVIMVSQRVSAVKQSDLILVMEDGCLVGVGTHNELLNSCDEYKEICASQERGEGAAK